MDRVRYFQGHGVKSVLLMVFFGLGADYVFGYDCDKLDPRVKLSDNTEIKVSGNAETVYKVAKAGGEVKIQANSAAQNVQDNVPLSEKSNAENRLLFLLCEMISKDDIPPDKKIELYKYVAEKLSPGPAPDTKPAGGADKSGAVPSVKQGGASGTVKRSDSGLTKSPEKSNVKPEPVRQKVISSRHATVDLYSDDATNAGQTVNGTAAGSGRTPSESEKEVTSTQAKKIEFGQECRDELSFEYAKYRQSSKYPSYFFHIRNNGQFKCDECVKNLADVISSKTGVPVTPDLSGYGAPGCIGYREDIGGSLKGAQCLAALLGEHYHVDRQECSADGFPYPIKLRR